MAWPQSLDFTSWPGNWNPAQSHCRLRPPESKGNHSPGDWADARLSSMTCSIWPQQHVLKVGSSWASWPQYSGCSSSLPLRSSLICPPLKVSFLLGSILLSLSWLATEHELSFSDEQPHTHCWNMCWAKAEWGEGFFGGPVAKTPCSQCRGLTPDWGTRPDIVQLRVHLPQPKIPRASTRMEDPVCCT